MGLSFLTKQVSLGIADEILRSPWRQWTFSAIALAMLSAAIVLHLIQSTRRFTPRGTNRETIGQAHWIGDRLRRASRWLSGAAAIVPVMVLFGWAVRSWPLVTLLPGAVGMNPVTALSLLLASVALRLATVGPNTPFGQIKNATLARRAFAAVPILVGAIKLISLLTRHDIPVDRLMFSDRLGMVPDVPINRMAPNTALCLLMVGAAIAGIDLRTSRGRRVAEMLALSSIAIAIVALLGYFYHVATFYDLPTFYAMAIHTAAVVILLAMGILFARPDQGIMAVITGDSVGGIASRRLLPTAVIMPVALGWLRLVLVQARLVDVEFSVAILVAANICLFTALIWSTAALLHKADVHRQETEMALREQERQYHTVVDQAAEGIYMIDAGTRQVIDANTALKRLLGYDHQLNVSGRSIYDLVADDPTRIDARIEQVLASDEPIKSERQYTRVDGARVDVEVSASHFAHNGRTLVCTIVHDITQRKRAESQRAQAEMALQAAISDLKRYNHMLERANVDLKQAQGQLVQSEKLIGLGQMVAGVAHEINNPLAFVVNNVAVLERDVDGLRKLMELFFPILQKPEIRDLPESREIEDYCEQIDLSYTLSNLHDLTQRSREGLKRIQQIVKDLRDFARLDEADVQEADINAGINSTLNIVRGRAKRKNVTIASNLGDIPSVMCAPGKINQVIMNLVANAIDACKEDGHVTVSSSRVDQLVLIEVQDDGTGIPEETRKRIFDPFFTTKPLGEGTGLGLSISYGIIQEHAGTISVESEVGQGTTFFVTLPIHSPVWGRGNVRAVTASPGPA